VEAPLLTPDTKAKVERVLQRALDDVEFRELLTLNPVEALRDVDLGSAEKTILGRMKRVQLEEWGIDMRRYRVMARDNGNKVSAT
jgi:hypothetical protein